tara:strand:+ start:985 stop:1197 length:213 start_codon:yes stop_codon:yes gene_type:complete
MTISIVEFENGYVVIGEPGDYFLDYVCQYADNNETLVKRSEILTNKKYKELESKADLTNGPVDLKQFFTK